MPAKWTVKAETSSVLDEAMISGVGVRVVGRRKAGAGVLAARAKIAAGRWHEIEALNVSAEGVDEGLLLWMVVLKSGLGWKEVWEQSLWAK